VLIPDRLEMLVTGDPVAELDAALSGTATQLRNARQHGDGGLAERLARWVDMRLDERNGFAHRFVPEPARDLGRCSANPNAAKVNATDLP
jgi:hypothetical protein